MKILSHKEIDLYNIDFVKIELSDFKELFKYSFFKENEKKEFNLEIDKNLYLKKERYKSKYFFLISKNKTHQFILPLFVSIDNKDHFLYNCGTDLDLTKDIHVNRFMDDTSVEFLEKTNLKNVYVKSIREFFIKYLEIRKEEF